MNRKLTSFSYKGETVNIYPGNVLPKNELIIRLKEINFLSIDFSYEKNHLNYIYDIALNYDINKIKIFNRLKKDTEYFNSRNSLYKRNIFDEFRSENTDGFQNNLFSREIRKNNNNNNFEDDSYKDNDFSGRSSFCTRVLGFINNHKIDILEKIFYLIIYLSFDAFLKNISKSNFILGKIINSFRSRITPRRAILGFLLYYIIKYILNTLFYYLFGFGILTIIYIIYKDKIKDLLFVILGNY